MARTEEFIREVDRYSARNYNPLPVVIERGEGVWVWDVEGNKYLDMLSAYSALNQGHRHPKIISALMEQAGKCTLTSRAFHNETMGPFLRTLCELAGYGKALPMNTGAEAVETAIKAARKWGLVRKGVPENQGEIIVCENNFHGRTVTIISFSSEEQYRYGFGPYTPGFVLVPYGDLEALEKAITPHTVAVLAEPIQGEGGVVVPPQGYLAKMRELATEHNLLMMLDEIQTGLGRTGRLFAYEHEGAKPDVLILGKALGGGVYPVSAVLASEEVLGVFNPGDHGSTFGGNPLGAAVAQAALEVILEEDLPGRAEQLGNYFLEGLKALNSPYVREIRGRGLLIGVEIKTEYGSARPFCQRLMAEGLLCKETREQTIRFAPPLVISKEEIDWALERIQKVLGA
ncbi:MAG TPA: ornithine--oxo-acid transaminase [Limnochordia bacterium]|nr:ornithine--oxo-acid transaminase [Limnochordia bacterium]